MKVLVTGGAGLVGSECCKLFSELGWNVISVDNYMRGRLFNGGDTKPTIMKLLEKYNIEHHELDFRDERVIELVRSVDAVVHTAAQPSHPKSIEIPFQDFEINALGTLRLLEALRTDNAAAVFILCSTNKVYGEVPNYFSYNVVGKRFEPSDSTLWDGFDENLRIDHAMHTPFGISKLAADLYAQEYARLYHLKTGIFRLGCITGGSAMAVEKHNWEPFFMRKALTGETLTIYGYDGFQVRDVIHARDLARLFLEFIRLPRPGEVYNIGGGRLNSISLLEAIDLIEEIAKKRINYKLGPPREADHKWWISNMRKLRAHYPSWTMRLGLRDIFAEIHENQLEILA